MAPRRTKAASRIKPPNARGEPEDYTVPITYPWPREEGTEISLTDLNIPKSSETRWDKEASRRYNTLLNTNIFPTRFVDAEALSDLGLHEDLHAVLQVMGIADLCHRTHPLYPDLVRQVLATAELTFKRTGFPIFEEASFTFFASGVKHSISLETLTEIYEISEEYTQTSFPRKILTPPFERWLPGKPRQHPGSSHYTLGANRRITLFPQPTHGHERREPRSPSQTRTSLILATAELTFKRPGLPIFEEAYFTLFASGVKHSISLETLTEIYEMSEEYTQTSFPRKFIPEQAFWKFIASGDFKSRSASQFHIRNPIL
ncbi:hypothetical protein F2Q68_00010038 [Brassica cretica]|uniref:Arabidopsis retrotransposon Orf1 C-terminal domain-containing protein n=1 Tax=Brassica cretica TaxID=69181 RepID=A0A8S9KYX5_BRACR|nr:hypothetical protein F2Q68_00010038 [Brassica cretica]